MIDDMPFGVPIDIEAITVVSMGKDGKPVRTIYNVDPRDGKPWTRERVATFQHPSWVPEDD